MGLLDKIDERYRINKTYLKTKMFGYPTEGNGWGSAEHNADNIYDSRARNGRMRHVMDGNYKPDNNISFWDMLKNGNVMGPIRDTWPLEKPQGYDARQESERQEVINRYNKERIEMDKLREKTLNPGYRVVEGEDY